MLIFSLAGIHLEIDSIAQPIYIEPELSGKCCRSLLVELVKTEGFFDG
jgi:hypothetical protein